VRGELFERYHHSVQEIFHERLDARAALHDVAVGYCQVFAVVCVMFSKSSDA